MCWQKWFTGHIACMTSLLVLLILLPQKYWKNFKRKFNDDSIWIIDSGASHLTTSKKYNLSSDKKFNCSHTVILGANSEMYAEGKGKLDYYFDLGDKVYF